MRMTLKFRTRLARLGGAFLAVLLGAGALEAAVECQSTAYEGRSYTICTADAARDDIRLFHSSGSKTIGSFTKLKAVLAPQGLDLTFAMNAGMYHDDRRPVGLYIDEQGERARLVPNPGPGNFGLLPNGVFCLLENRAAVIETLSYRENPPNCRFASQSGPMLVIDGKLHPKFLPDSTSRYTRNGVGVAADGRTVYFVISNERVTFYEFATLFRDKLGVPNALYFDGNVSRMYAPSIKRHDKGFPMGPIVGVVAPVQ